MATKTKHQAGGGPEARALPVARWRAELAPPEFLYAVAHRLEGWGPETQITREAFEAALDRAGLLPLRRPAQPQQ